jgi:ATP-dependent RNA helicase RhlE
VLRELLSNERGKTLVFARTKRGTERLTRDLDRLGFSVSMIHGDRTQSQRLAALAGFEEGRHQVLVATDVAARGLHISDVAHVINYELPNLAEDFIHRVGRTGRAGQSGRASAIVSGAEMIELRRFEKALKLHIERKEPAIASFEAEARPRSAGARAKAGRDTNTLRTRTLTRLALRRVLG